MDCILENGGIKRGKGASYWVAFGAIKTVQSESSISLNLFAVKDDTRTEKAKSRRGNTGRRKSQSGVEERAIVSLMLSHLIKAPEPHPMFLWE